MKRKETIMRYVIFYDIAGTRVFSISDKGDSCFLTRGEAQRKIQNALSTIPVARINILREVKSIREEGRYWVLAPTGEHLTGEQRKLEAVGSDAFDHRHEGEYLLKNKNFTEGKFVMDQVYSFRIKVRIKE
ncbi:MAG: hypothetical protein Q8N59_01350 [bacterium]|nr:hypothetical protein [bacterium]